MAKIFTDDNFQAEVLDQEGLVLVDLWAPWCGPCVMLTPIIEEISQEMEGKVIVGKLNVDENQATSQKFNVVSIPTVLLLKNGEVIETFVGVRPKDEYLAAIEANQ